LKPIQIHNLAIDCPNAAYLVLAGPTAVGKTDLVLQLAEQCELEVISADSRQIYKYMDIGTATPSAQLQEQVPHHLLNTLTPDVVWNAASFYQQARQLVLDIIQRGHLPLVVGGAGLYLEALRNGLFDEQHQDPAVRRKYEQLIAAGEAETLWQRLLKLDPEYAGSFHHHNHKKLMRAFEILETTGMIPSKCFANSQDSFDQPACYVILDRERPLLYERINQRVLQMVKEGLIQECQQLLSVGYGPELYPLRTIGYQEVFAHLAGELSEPEMIALIQKHTRNFAKRQLTWFRNHPFDHWIDLGSG